MAINSQYTDHDSQLTIQVGGLFNFTLLNDFRQAYRDAKAQQARIEVDLRETIAMDSSALGMLLNMQRHLAKADGEIRIINASPDVKKVLLIARFDKKFAIE